MRKSVPDNPICSLKARQAFEFIRLELEPEPAFKAAVITESVAQGDARETSDIDMVLLFEPLRWDVVPGDFLWSPLTRQFRTRHESAAPDMVESVHFDTNRVDLADYRRGNCEEAWRFLLSAGVLVYDRDSEAEAILDMLVQYPPKLRQERVGSNVYYVDYHLTEQKALSWIERSGPVAAHAHVTAGLEYLVKLLFAYHSTWLTWPNKRIPVLLRMPDPVGTLHEALSEGTMVKEMTAQDVARRVGVLRDYFDRLVQVLQKEGLLPLANPFEYAFGVEWPQIGMRHSMADWLQAHAEYLAEKERRRR